MTCTCHAFSSVLAAGARSLADSPAEDVAVAAVDGVREVVGDVGVVEAAEGGRHGVVTLGQPHGAPTTRERAPLDRRVTLHKRLQKHTSHAW